MSIPHREPNRWFSGIGRQHSARVRLLCFPHAGGGTTVFSRWASHMHPCIEFCSVRLPGRETRLREPLMTRIDPLVEMLTEAITPHCDLPFAFFGHSMGALIAFELARTLVERQMARPIHLFVSAHPAPQLLRTSALEAGNDDAMLVDHLVKLNGTPMAVLEHAELMSLLLPILRADLEMCATYTYRPGGPLDCPISAFGGIGDSAITGPDLCAWRQHTRSSFNLQMFPGDHFYIQSGPEFVSKAVSRALLADLDHVTRDLAGRARDE